MCVATVFVLIESSVAVSFCSRPSASSWSTSCSRSVRTDGSRALVGRASPRLLGAPGDEAPDPRDELGRVDRLDDIVAYPGRRRPRRPSSPGKTFVVGIALSK
jgi:hypothetical protein